MEGDGSSIKRDGGSIKLNQIKYETQDICIHSAGRHAGQYVPGVGL
jgi:hypothetical protein